MREASSSVVPDGGSVPSVEHGIRTVVSRFSRSKFFRTVGPTIMPPLEHITAKLTRGGRPLSGYPVPSLVLDSTGARSGLERATEQMYVPEGNRMLITGSNFARAVHPAWTASLLAHPEAAVTIKGNRLHVTAEVVQLSPVDSKTE
jgi:deazaflavin-dependent oxidoreductase (nitroreductase family)